MEFYHKHHNLILDTIDLAHTTIDKNERVRLRRQFDKLMLKVRIQLFHEGYEACLFQHKREYYDELERNGELHRWDMSCG